MCFDKDSSLLAWTLSYTIAIYLFYRNRNIDRWSAGFIICFATIQLLEAGLWSTQEHTSAKDHSKEINDLITRMILIALVCQPFFQTYLGYKFTDKAPAGIKQLLSILTFIFLGIILWSFYRIGKSKPGEFSSAPGPRGHMIWTDAKSPNNFLGGNGIMGILTPILYFIGLFLPLCFAAYYSSSMRPLLLLGVGIITAIYSMKYAGGKEFSSYWCFSAVAYSIAALFV